MAKWLLVLAAVAALAWWASRPAAARRRGAAARKNIRMSQCDRCGVYVEPGGACKCKDAAGSGEK